jgi:hypothetical protein
MQLSTVTQHSTWIMQTLYSLEAKATLQVCAVYFAPKLTGGRQNHGRLLAKAIAARLPYVDFYFIGGDFNDCY